MEKIEIYKAVECCASFLCGECPYNIYESKNYPLKCVSHLMRDLNSLLNGGEQL